MKQSPTIAASIRRVVNAFPLHAKRSNGGVWPVDTWYPYYAGFSADFAKGILQGIDLLPAATVLDPWNGSGTTTHVADLLGYRAIGIDINPVATLIANAKLARAKDTEYILGFARRVTAKAVKTPAIVSSTDPLLAWLSQPVVEVYRSIEGQILSDLAARPDGSLLNSGAEALPPLASFLSLALLRAAKSVARIRMGTNPTWVAPEMSTRGARGGTLVARWLTLLGEMSHDLLRHDTSSLSQPFVQVGDSRHLPFQDASVDFVLTSPPYCTRLDYAVSTSFELAALGAALHPDAFKEFRRSLMGTPLARSGPALSPPPNWPGSVRRLLGRIRRHPSKASSSYYYKTYRQYFDDCDRSLTELRRCLKPGASAVLVLQTSYYKNIRVDLPGLWGAMGEAQGFAASIASSLPVHRALTQINSRSAAHRKTTRYSESILTLRKCT